MLNVTSGSTYDLSVFEPSVVVDEAAAHSTPLASNSINSMEGFTSPRSGRLLDFDFFGDKPRRERPAKLSALFKR